MPLPNGGSQPWPPDDHAATYLKFTEWSAWYSGDPMRLRDFYANQTSPTYRSSPWSQFWSRIGARPGQQKAQFHVPIAGDISSVGASLLFGVAPRIRVAAAHEALTGRPIARATSRAALAGPEAAAAAVDGPPPDEAGEDLDAIPAGDPAARQSEARLKAILDQGGFYNRLLEAAEAASAMGGAYLVPVWDETIADHPLVAVNQADSALPTFRFGLLESVIFHRVVLTEGEVVVRHLELHERQAGGMAHILNGCYRGGERYLGTRVGDGLARELSGAEPEVVLPFAELDAEYVPNMRPNKLWRSSSLGLSDYSGSEQLFDALDEVYASWIRDIRLAKARILVPKEYVDEFGAFDVDHEVFTPVNMEPITQSGAMPILAQQFQIRYQDHLSTALEFLERIVSNAGYSPQTYGLHIMGRAESGTALRMRENRTMMTKARKAGWWEPALERLCGHLIEIDRAVFKTKIESALVEVELSDSMVRDPSELAMTANVLKQAMAASTQERVKMVQPDWTPEEVAAEVARILDEGTPTTAWAVSPAAPDASVGLAALRNGPPDQAAPGAPAVPPTAGPQPGAPPARPPMPTGLNRSAP